jgi:Tol biopolymer transport system component
MSNMTQLWVSRRAVRTDPFPAATVIASLVDPNGTGFPSISADGLDLYYTGDNGGRAGVYVSHRASTASLFGSVAESGAFGYGDISSDGLTFYDMDFGTPLRVYARPATDVPFGSSVDLGAPVNDGSTNGPPSISSDERELYFESDRSGGHRIWVATRTDRTAAFDSVALVEVSDAQDNPEISADGHHLYFTYNDGLTNHIRVSSRCE